MWSDSLWTTAPTVKKNCQSKCTGLLRHIAGPSGIIGRLKLKDPKSRNNAAKIGCQFMRPYAPRNFVFVSRQAGMHKFMRD